MHMLKPIMVLVCGLRKRGKPHQAPQTEHHSVHVARAERQRQARVAESSNVQVPKLQKTKKTKEPTEEKKADTERRWKHGKGALQKNH